MVVVETPGIADRFKAIGPVIAVEVADTRDLCLLGDPETAIAISQAEHLIEPAGKLLKRWLGVGLEGSVDQPDFTAAGADRETAIRQHLKTPALQSQLLSNRHIDDPVVLLLTFGSPPELAQRLGERRPRQTGREDQG